MCVRGCWAQKSTGLQAWHVAGERNQDADKLSRRNCPGFQIEDEHFRAFPPELQMAISVTELFAPSYWKG